MLGTSVESFEGDRVIPKVLHACDDDNRYSRTDTCQPNYALYGMHPVGRVHLGFGLKATHIFLYLLQRMAMTDPKADKSNV